MHEVRRALHQGIAHPKLLGELQEAAALNAGIRKVGLEVVQRLLLGPVAGRECDLDAARLLLVPLHDRLHSPVGGDIDQLDVMNSHAIPRQEDVQHRQRAMQCAAGELHTHVLGSEEAIAQDRVHGDAQGCQRLRQRAAHGMGQLRHPPDRLQAAHDISRSTWKQRVRIEEIRPTEHVEHDRPLRRDVGL